jgi:hypothetical protein
MIDALSHGPAMLGRGAAILTRYFHALFARASSPGRHHASAATRAAVERVIDGVDPRLRAVPRYRRTLWRPVERALDYLAESVNALPPAIAFDRRGSSLDPRLRALFLGPDHLLETLSSSPDVQDYLRQLVGTPPPHLYVALRVERTERAIFGIALEDDRLMRDVPQTTVSFHNYRIAFPATAESETRRQIQARAFDYLIELAKHRLARTRARRQQLEHRQRWLLQGQAGTFGAGRLGYNRPGSAGPIAWIEGCEGLKLQEIEEIEDELARLRADSATLVEQLDLVAAIIGEPGAHLRIARVSMTLDLMNVKVLEGSPASAATLTFNEMLIGTDRRITIETIRFPSNQLLPPVDFRRETRWALQPGRV